MVHCRIAVTLVLALGIAAVTGGQSTPAGDWPQWRGPERTGLSRESGLLQQWPSSGPRLVWSASNLGAGYGSVSVSKDRIFVQGMRGRVCHRQDDVARPQRGQRLADLCRRQPLHPQ